MSGEELFWKLAAELMRDDPRVVESRIMGGRCLRVHEEFLALVTRQRGGLVVKLPRARVEELVENGQGEPFAPAGKVFREWIEIVEVDRRRWKALLREAIDFVAPRS